MTRDEHETLTRQVVLQAAYEDLGNGDPTEYWEENLAEDLHGKRYPKHWCGVAVLTWLKRAGLAIDVPWRIGFGFLEVRPYGLQRTDHPLPGDVAFFARAQHHALVVSVDGQRVKLIQGNSREGRTRHEEPHVRTSEHDLAEVKAFYSIRPYIDRAWEHANGAG
jgi:hypothetical protein